MARLPPPPPFSPLPNADVTRITAKVNMRGGMRAQPTPRYPRLSNSCGVKRGKCGRDAFSRAMSSTVGERCSGHVANINGRGIRVVLVAAVVFRLGPP